MKIAYTPITKRRGAVKGLDESRGRFIHAPSGRAASDSFQSGRAGP
jgi:hypothetical protein